MRKIPFVDAHVHLWDLSRIHYPWLSPPFSDDGPNGSVAPIARNYSLDDYLQDASGWNVVGMVHVEAGADSKSSLDETRWLQAIVDERGMPQAIVAYADLTDPDLELFLEAHLTCANVRGIRQIVNWHPDTSRTYTPRDLTLDPQWESGFELIGRRGLSFDLQAYPHQFTQLARIVRKYPDTQVVLNHTGMAVPSDPDGWETWRAGLRLLAELPNVACKISGMGFARRDWDTRFARDYVLQAIDMFGPRRAMFASDFPTDRLFGSFDHTLGSYAEIISGFSDEEKRDLFGRNAVRIYRLSLIV